MLESKAQAEQERHWDIQLRKRRLARLEKLQQAKQAQASAADVLNSVLAESTDGTSSDVEDKQKLLETDASESSQNDPEAAGKLLVKLRAEFKE